MGAELGPAELGGELAELVDGGGARGEGVVASRPAAASSRARSEIEPAAGGESEIGRARPRRGAGGGAPTRRATAASSAATSRASAHAGARPAARVASITASMRVTSSSSADPARRRASTFSDAAAAHHPSRSWAAKSAVASPLARAARSLSPASRAARATSIKVSARSTSSPCPRSSEAACSARATASSVSPAASSASRAIREHRRTGEPQRLVRLLGVVEPAEGLDEVTAPTGQPGQVVAHVRRAPWSIRGRRRARGLAVCRASAVPISPLHPCSTPRFERRSASIEGSMPATSASRAVGERVSSASSLRPARCNSPASWLMARTRSSPVSSSTARRPKASDCSNSPEYDSDAASDIEHRPSSSASPSSTAPSTAARR